MDNALFADRKKEIEHAVNGTYTHICPFVRDTNLPSGIVEKYVPGTIIREPGYTDVSHKIGGMVTSHRYFILSNHMADLVEFDRDTNWGLCCANRDARYKVLGTHFFDGKYGIFLLHLLDDESWKIWIDASISLDSSLFEKAVEQFKKTCQLPPVPELATEAWLERCIAPLGIDNEGNFFSLDGLL